MTSTKNIDWTVEANPDGMFSFEAAQLAVLKDIRAELQLLNAELCAIDTLLSCTRIPKALDAIIRMDPKRRKRRNTR